MIWKWGSSYRVDPFLLVAIIFIFKQVVTCASKLNLLQPFYPWNPRILSTSLNDLITWCICYIIVKLYVRNYCIIKHHFGRQMWLQMPNIICRKKSTMNFKSTSPFWNLVLRSLGYGNLHVALQRKFSITNLHLCNPTWNFHTFWFKLWKWVWGNRNERILPSMQFINKVDVDQVQ